MLFIAKPLQASEDPVHSEEIHVSGDDSAATSVEEKAAKLLPGEVEAGEFNGEFAIHHVLDSHEWHFWDMPTESGNYKPLYLSLPIIVWADGSFHVFSSANFYHPEVYGAVDHHDEHHAADVHGDSATHDTGHHVMRTEQDGITFMLDHGGIITAMKDGKELSVVDLSITKTVIALFFTCFLMFWIFGATAKFYRKNGTETPPRGIAGFTEPLILYVRDEIVKPQIGDKHYARFMPFLLTAFFFIWITNLVGLFPGLGFNLTGNIAVTMVLAAFTFVLTNINGNKAYWMHIFRPPGVPVALLPIIVPIEIAGLFIKPAALMIRLFANITAGHIVIMSLIAIVFKMQTEWWGLMSVPMTLFISVLELLVAALQAYIFVMLSSLFIGAAVQEAHH
jgi:F-type H+-transporting ATPase subunit a